MELALIFRILLRYWWLVLIPVAVTAVLAAPALLDRGPAVHGGYSTAISYSAAQQLEAIPNRDGDYQDVWLASELAVNAFTDWITSNSFARAVAEAASARGSEIAAGSLAIAADNERSVGRIFLTWPDAETLAVIADSAIEVLRTGSAAAFPQLGGAPALVTVLDEPVITSAPPPLADRFGPFVRLALGLAAGIGLAFLAHYLDPFLRRREDLESLGLPVVSTIPRR
jgi:capsular polysaccharide biosynthesis protein